MCVWVMLFAAEIESCGDEAGVRNAAQVVLSDFLTFNCSKA
jgi:hypothetical protein